MRVVILAAGRGSRLGDSSQLPKPLTQLANGNTLLGQQIANLSHFFSPQEITLVVGYYKEKIIHAFPDCHHCINDHYAQENTSKSLLKGIHGIDDDLLWLNGDVLFHPSLLEGLIQGKRNAMLVNQDKTGEEEVKYRSLKDGQIVEVSKKVSQPQGEALGINLMTQQDLPLFRNALEECQPHDYFERAIELALPRGLQIYAHPVGHSLCIEIDFPEDLQQANKLLLSWK